MCQFHAALNLVLILAFTSDFRFLLSFIAAVFTVLMIVSFGSSYCKTALDLQKAVRFFKKGKK